MDTDSVHTCNLSVEDAAKYIDIDQTRLGAFKLEYTCKRAKYIRQKCYIEEQEFTDGTQTYTNYIRKCAGMPEDVKEWISWDAFNLGFEFDPESENLPKDLIQKSAQMVWTSTIMQLFGMKWNGMPNYNR